jgi:hypothetical protein
MVKIFSSCFVSEFHFAREQAQADKGKDCAALREGEAEAKIIFKREKKPYR